MAAQEAKRAVLRKKAERVLLVVKNAALDEHVQLDKEAPPSLLIDCSVIFCFDWFEY